MQTKNRRLISIIGALAVVAVTGCASFKPTPMDEVGFQDHAESITKGDITVTVSVLSAEETKAVFNTKLYKKKIQPIWVEITNGADHLLGFLPRSVDPTTSLRSRSLKKAQKPGPRNPIKPNGSSTSRTRCPSNCLPERPHPALFSAT